MNKHQQNLLINGLLGLLIILVLIKIMSKKCNKEAYVDYNVTVEEEDDVIAEEEELISHNPNRTNKNGGNSNHDRINNMKNRIKHKGANVRIVPGKDVNVKARKFNGVLNIYSPDIRK